MFQLLRHRQQIALQRVLLLTPPLQMALLQPQKQPALHGVTVLLELRKLQVMQAVLYPQEGVKFAADDDRESE